MKPSQRARRAEEMSALLAEHAETGASLAAFARNRDIPVRTLYYWSRRLRQRPARAARATEDPRLAPVRIVPDPPSPPHFEVELRSGRTLRLFPGFDLAVLVPLVAALESC